MSILWRSILIICIHSTRVTQEYSTIAPPSSHENSIKTIEDYNKNVTYQAAQNLRDRGYVIKEFNGLSPVVMIGDVAYDPKQLASQLPSGRLTAFMKTQHWIDSDGMPHTRYFFDTESKADKTLFKKATESWIDKTCIRFEKLPDGPCKQDLPYPSICVGDYGGNCWSYIGNIRPKGGEPQQLSVAKVCDLAAMVHEFGHSLGAMHQQVRPDRNEYITVNFENIKLTPSMEKLQFQWAQGSCQTRDTVVDLPIPYDYLSVMQYSTASYASDYRAVYVTKNVRYQYMLNYRRFAEHLQSHYDLFTVNTVYGCDKSWRDSCVKNGKNPPKCQNFGYVNKNCECICPTGFDGSSCEKKTGPMFPLKPKAKVLIEVQEAKMVDLTEQTMSTENFDGKEGFWNAYQFLTVVVDGKDPNTHVSITVIQTVSKCEGVMGYWRGTIIEDIGHQDCTLIYMWGLSSSGLLRSDCFSTVANNEPEGPWFRGKTHHLDITAQSSFGYGYSDPQLSIQLIQLKLSVVFVPRPDKLLKVEPKNPSWAGGLAGAAAMTAASSAGMAAGGVILAVLLLAAAAAALGYYRTKVKRSADAETEAESVPGSREDAEGDSSADESNSEASADSEATEDEKDENQEEDVKDEADDKKKTSEKKDPSK